MQHSDLICCIGNRMVEYGVEPTREDFAAWLRESSEVSEERREAIQALHSQGTPIWEILGKRGSAT